MKSKEHVAKQGVAREGKVGERIKSVCALGGGRGGGRERNTRVYISQ